MKFSYEYNIEKEYKSWKRKRAIENLLNGLKLDDSFSTFSKILPFQKDYWL